MEEAIYYLQDNEDSVNGYYGHCEIDINKHPLFADYGSESCMWTVVCA